MKNILSFSWLIKKSPKKNNSLKVVKPFKKSSKLDEPMTMVMFRFSNVA